jgi:hypothetical protein
MVLFLALACAPAEEPYPFDQIRDTDDTDTGEDTDTDDTDEPDDTGDTDDTADTGGDDVTPFTVVFTGTAVTVSGTPLGFDDSIRDTPISGSFTWNVARRDVEEDNADVGIYDHIGDGAARIVVGGRTVEGSGSPRLEVENFDGADTFRYVDGASVGGDRFRQMTIDGEGDAALGLWTAFTDSTGAALASDAVLTTWPFPEITSLPHTFALEDAGGTLLLQLTTIGPE